MTQPKQYNTTVALARFGCLASSVSRIKIGPRTDSKLVRVLMQGLKVVETHQGKPGRLKQEKKKRYGRA